MVGPPPADMPPLDGGSGKGGLRPVPGRESQSRDGSRLCRAGEQPRAGDLSAPTPVTARHGPTGHGGAGAGALELTAWPTGLRPNRHPVPNTGRPRGDDAKSPAEPG